MGRSLIQINAASELDLDGRIRAMVEHLSGKGLGKVTQGQVVDRALKLLEIQEGLRDPAPPAAGGQELV